MAGVAEMPIGVVAQAYRPSAVDGGESDLVLIPTVAVGLGMAVLVHGGPQGTKDGPAGSTLRASSSRHDTDLAWRDQQTLTVMFTSDGVGVDIWHGAGQRRGPADTLEQQLAGSEKAVGFEARPRRPPSTADHRRSTTSGSGRLLMIQRRLVRRPPSEASDDR